MWLFRRRWRDLTAEQQAKLTALFEAVPELGFLYHHREALADIFDTAANRTEAAERIAAWRAEAVESGLDWSSFLNCYDRHRDGILAYFDERKTSGVVEGLNNKARVVLKRCFGLKAINTFWTRLLVEGGRLVKHGRRTIADLRAVAHALRASFCGDYT